MCFEVKNRLVFKLRLVIGLVILLHARLGKRWREPEGVSRFCSLCWWNSLVGNPAWWKRSLAGFSWTRTWIPMTSLRFCTCWSRTDRSSTSRYDSRHSSSNDIACVSDVRSKGLFSHPYLQSWSPFPQWRIELMNQKVKPNPHGVVFACIILGGMHDHFRLLRLARMHGPMQGMLSIMCTTSFTWWTGTTFPSESEVMVEYWTTAPYSHTLVAISL